MPKKVTVRGFRKVQRELRMKILKASRSKNLRETVGKIEPPLDTGSIYRKRIRHILLTKDLSSILHLQVNYWMIYLRV